MRRLLFRFAFIITAISAFSTEHLAVRELILLTRDGCTNTARMRSNLNEALKSLSLPANYTVVDIDKLAPADRRRGYGTPTVLHRGRDLFGKLNPPPQAAAPS